MDKKIDSKKVFNSIVRWAIGNVAWEISVRLVSALSVSVFYIWRFIHPKFSEGVLKMNIPPVAIVGMWFGFFVAALIIVAILIWLTKLLVVHFSIPTSEVRRFLQVTETILDQRINPLTLIKSGLRVEKKKEKDGSLFYKFIYSGQSIYQFSIKPLVIENGYHPNSVGFNDGLLLPNAYTAIGTIRVTLDTPIPKISLENYSLIVDDYGNFCKVGEITYEELAELIWKKVSKTIKSRMKLRL